MLKLFLCGDVMMGRGVDQILPHPSEPSIPEDYATSACDYVELAERARGLLPRKVHASYVWGDALAELERAHPDVRIANLETAITTSTDAWPGKEICFRMHPENIACLAAARLDACVVANNHVLDWGRAGLAETLATLKAAGIRTAGAGHEAASAEAPSVVALAAGRRVLVYGYAMPSSGVPAEWAATHERSGVNLLADLSPASVEAVARQVERYRSEGDCVVVSIHWGPNWGYDVRPEERAFAHALVETAHADVVHGHSSHHPRGIEVHYGRPILYGCGDLLNDYEGIASDQRFRSDLSLMYFVTLGARWQLARLEMVPVRIRGFRIERAPREDEEALHAALGREFAALGTRIEAGPHGRWRLAWERTERPHRATVPPATVPS